MSRIGTIARRTFLIGSAALVGGVAYGVYYARKELPNPLEVADGEVTLNPYLIINQDGITIITPRAEMGQGVQSTLATLVAEELDVDPLSVKAMHGPAARTYYNAALMHAALPVADYKKTNVQDRIADAMAILPKAMGLQLTGGSTSIPDGYEKMRFAGATARETFKLAAAERLGVRAGRLETEDGHVVAPDGTRLSYIELAEEAALIDPPRNVELRPQSQWKHLGTSTPRLDTPAKSTGTAEFGIDVRLPGMKYAALRRNPGLGGKMIRFDASTAEDMAGVEKVVAFEDGVAVVASNTWLAEQAVQAIDVEWEAAPYPGSMEEIRGVVAAGFDTDPNSTLRDDGDVETGLTQGTRIAAEYEVPFLAHATMEPMNATALFSGDALEVWCGNQAPVLVQQKCAEVVNLDAEQVTVHTTFLGGGFGRRAEFDFAVLAALTAFALPNVPIQLSWSREEDMSHDFYRPFALARFEGTVENGTAVALKGAISAQSVMEQSLQRIAGMGAAGPDKVHVEGAFDQPYAIPNFRIAGHHADLAIPVGSWRSVGNSKNGFFMESFMDEMAHAVEADPLEFRLALMRPEHAPSAAVLEKVADMANWTGETPEGVGRGVAFTYSFGTPVAQIVEVTDEDGAVRLSRMWIACDPGIALNPATIEAQMQGGAIYALSAALWGEITFTDGAADQLNFPDYEALRIHTAPRIEVGILENNPGIGGIGEPGTPPAAAALANAVFDLTGTRVRKLPMMHEIDFIA